MPRSMLIEFKAFVALDHSTGSDSLASFYSGIKLRTLEHDIRLALSHVASLVPCIYVFIFFAYHKFSFHQL